MGVCTGTFQYPNGSPVASGLYQWKLSGDCIEYSVACVAPILFTGFLDTNGNMTATFLFNDVLSTTAGATTTYQFTVKAPGGGQVWNEMYYLTGTAANLNLYPPGGVPLNTVTASALLLETNGTVNSDQLLLNLVAGTNVTLTNVAGATTINVATSTATLAARTGLIGYVIDGGGTTVSTGIKGQIDIPVPMTVTGWVLTADQSGSAVVDVNAGSYASFPTLSSITASDKPTLSSAQKNENLTATTWSGSLAAGTQLQFSVTSATTVTRLNVNLIVSIPYA